MALGSYMGVSFTVSDRRILTPSGLKDRAGASGQPTTEPGQGQGASGLRPSCGNIRMTCCFGHRTA